jgi:rRNA-processing protein FCF1
MTSINITWNISPRANDAHFKDLLIQHGGTELPKNTAHQKWVCKCGSLTIQYFGKTLVIQGPISDQNKEIISELSKCEGLSLEGENIAKYAHLFDFGHNAIICNTCKHPVMLIEGKERGLDFIFEKECGHKTELKPPIFMITNRILPDVNALVGGLISKGLRIGLFTGFEIVVASFVITVIDNLGKREKEMATRELEALRKYAESGKISIFMCKDGEQIPSREEFDAKEDQIILNIAKLTNSILFTTDNVMKERAMLQKRPTIYMHPQYSKHLAMVADVRNPRKDL